MLDLLPQIDPGEWSREVILAVVAGLGALVLFAQSVMSLVSRAQTQRVLNRRLSFQEKTSSTGELIVELRKQRALDDEGNFKLAMKGLNRLITRSGIAYEPAKWAAVSLLLSAAAGAAVYMRFGLLWGGIGLAIILLPLLPYAWLKFMAGRRTKKLAKQLPDALQIVVRSLEAGHPVPGAIGLVAREMPDPVGTEFGMASDEMAYGFSLAKSVERLAARSGDADIDLFAATVRLQERTGGNLCDLLKTNAATIRDRQTLRLKVKAASAEGRASAMILTSAPFVVMVAIHFMRPEFYGLVADEPLFRYSLVGFGIWMFIGNLVMNRMINFKF